MTQVIFEPGDQFIWKDGSGVVLSSGKAFILGGPGGRSGYTQTVGVLPDDAVPGTVRHFEVKFALDAVTLVVKEGQNFD